MLDPYRTAEGHRVAFEGLSLPVGPQAATAVTLLLHELATNAVKYGALGPSGGVVSLAWRHEGADVVITWSESGGPPLAGAPRLEGFGSRLTRTSVEGQLGGSLALAWEATGFVATMRVKAEALAG